MQEKCVNSVGPRETHLCHMHELLALPAVPGTSSLPETPAVPLARPRAAAEAMIFPGSVDTGVSEHK